MANIIETPSFIRGDSYLFKVPVKHRENDIPLQETDVDTIFVTFKETTSKTSTILFSKDLSDITIDENGYCHIAFNPSDTESLNYGTYYFDIEITLKNGYRKTQTYSVKITDETTSHGG